jgi:cell fate regulator YaaT (PSP1 superfamily)
MNIYIFEEIDYKHLLVAHTEVSNRSTLDDNNNECTAQAKESKDTTVQAENNLLDEKIELTIINRDVRSVVEVEFKGNRRELYRNDNKLSFRCAEYVVVETDTGYDLGKVINCQLVKNREELIESHLPPTLPKYNIVRHTNSDDMKIYFQNRENEPIVIMKTKQLVRKRNLEMKIIDAEWQFDKKRLTIYFTAPHRIDFRDLLKDLARTFKTRIELRQISYREETRRIGNGVGSCGLTLCCSSFLHNLSDVTLEHARTQQLTSNATKLCGNCGKFKCCLLFEYELYAHEIEKLPPLNSVVTMTEGEATIQKIDIFKEIIYLKVESQDSLVAITFDDLNKYILQGKVFPPEVIEADSQKLYCDEEVNYEGMGNINIVEGSDSIN